MTKGAPFTLVFYLDQIRMLAREGSSDPEPDPKTDPIPETGISQSIYSDFLVPGYTDVSWNAAVNLDRRDSALSGRSSIGVEFSPWGALSFLVGTWGDLRFLPTDDLQGFSFRVESQENLDLYLEFSGSGVFRAKKISLTAGQPEHIIVQSTELWEAGSSLQRMSIKASGKASVKFDDIGFIGIP